MTLNARKNKIARNDFATAFTAAKIDSKAQENIIKKFEKVIPEWMKFIEISFLTEEFKKKYKQIVDHRINQID